MPSTTQWFDELYEEFYPQLLKAALHMTSDHHFAEDLVQTAFTTLYEKREEVLSDPNIKLKGWLMKTMKNKFSSEMQRASRARELPLDDKRYLQRTTELDIPFEATLPAGLSPEERTVLILFYKDGYSHSDIAAQLGCSVTASRMRLFRALTHFKNLEKIENFKK